MNSKVPRDCRQKSSCCKRCLQWEAETCRLVHRPLSCFDRFWMLLVFYVGHRSSCLLPNKRKCSNFTKSQPRWTSFTGNFPCQQSVWTTEGLKLNIKGWKFRPNTLTWRILCRRLGFHDTVPKTKVCWLPKGCRINLSSVNFAVHAINKLHLLEIGLKSFWTLASARVHQTTYDAMWKQFRGYFIGLDEHPLSSLIWIQTQVKLKNFRASLTTDHYPYNSGCKKAKLSVWKFVFVSNFFDYLQKAPELSLVMFCRHGSLYDRLCKNSGVFCI